MRMAQRKSSMGVACKQVLSNTHCPHRLLRSNSHLSECIYLFGERPLWIWQHSPGMLSIDTLARQNCSSRTCRKIANSWKFANIVKLKTHENLALYGMHADSQVVLCPCRLHLAPRVSWVESGHETRVTSRELLVWAEWSLGMRLE